MRSEPLGKLQVEVCQLIIGGGVQVVEQFSNA